MIFKIDVSHVLVYFFGELRDIAKKELLNQKHLNLVVLPGTARTGTSVLHECLYATNTFREKNSLKLLGFPPTEHLYWRLVNFMLADYLDAKRFLDGVDTRMADFHTGEFNPDKPLNEEIKQEMDDFIGIISWQKLRLLKEPNCQFALKSWIDNYECFQNAKYIWTRRDYLESAKSLVRLKVPDRENLSGDIVPTEYRGKLKVNTAVKLFKQWDGILAKTMPKVKHIEIWHHDLINKPDETFSRISEFLGVEVNTEPFDRGKVWKNMKTCTQKMECMGH